MSSRSDKLFRDLVNVSRCNKCLRDVINVVDNFIIEGPSAKTH